MFTIMGINPNDVTSIHATVDSPVDPKKAKITITNKTVLKDVIKNLQAVLFFYSNPRPVPPDGTENPYINGTSEFVGGYQLNFYQGDKLLGISAVTADGTKFVYNVPPAVYGPFLMANWNLRITLSYDLFPDTIANTSSRSTSTASK